MKSPVTNRFAVLTYQVALKTKKGNFAILVKKTRVHNLCCPSGMRRKGTKLKRLGSIGCLMGQRGGLLLDLICSSMGNCFIQNRITEVSTYAKKFIFKFLSVNSPHIFMRHQTEHDNCIPLYGGLAISSLSLSLSLANIL
jgi:hypothetical protein